MSKEKGCDKHEKGGCHFCSIHPLYGFFWLHLCALCLWKKSKPSDAALQTARKQQNKSHFVSCSAYKNILPLTSLHFKGEIIPAAADSSSPFKPQAKWRSPVKWVQDREKVCHLKPSPLWSIWQDAALSWQRKKTETHFPFGLWIAEVLQRKCHVHHSQQWKVKGEVRFF